MLEITGLIDLQVDNTTKDKIKRLRSTHDYYKVYEWDWQFFVDSYTGGEAAIARNIFKHQRENKEDFNDRTKRAHYFNYCAVTVDFYTNFIFNDVIDRSGGPDEEEFNTFISNVNRKGDNVDAFMYEVSNNGRIYGEVFILVDMPVIDRIEGEVVTEKQKEEQNITPYWIMVLPSEVLDWDTDDFGNYNYIKRQQHETNINQANGERIYLEKYTEFFLETVKKTIIDVTDPKKPKILSEETGINPLKVIPFVCVKYKKSKKYKGMGDSFLIDIARSNRAILNFTNMMDEFLYRQCFNILAKEQESLFPLQSADESKFGSSNVIYYPKGGKPPEYVSPPITPAQALSDERQVAVNEIFRQAIQDLRSDLANGEKSSGFSQAQSFSRTVPFISTWAQKLEDAEKKLFQLTWRYLAKDFKGSVKYKDHYEITNIVDEMTSLLMLFKDLCLPSETFAKTQMKRLVKELYGKLNHEDQLKVMKEIDALKFDEWQDKVRQVDQEILKATMSPTAQQKSKSTGTMNEIKKESVKGKQGATKKLKS